MTMRDIDENPVDRPPGSNLARLDEVALEDCAAGRYGLHCLPRRLLLR
jgi:hypothetical protein